MSLLSILGMGANFNKKTLGKNIGLNESQRKPEKIFTEPKILDYVPHELDILSSFNQNETSQNNSESVDSAKIKNVDYESLNFELSENDTPFETEQQVNEYRKKNQIRVFGSDIPNPFKTFYMMKTRYEYKNYLEKNMIRFGFLEPTPIQKQAIPISLDKRDLIACAPTGSGKTLAFLLPMINLIENNLDNSKELQGVIISPTRELANQIHERFQQLVPKKKIAASLLTKTSNANKMQDPKAKKKFLLDEADRLLDQGFVEQVDNILSECNISELQISIFSATVPSMVEALAGRIMKDPVKVFVGASNAATDTIDQNLVFVGQEEGKLIEIRNMINAGFQPPCLIFVQSIERAKELFFELIYDGINVEVIHADKTKNQRDKIIESFRQGKLWILISTELMARGIDFKGVNLVINYDFPQTVESYIHRIGRTGRAGRAGKAITYFTKDDSPYLKNVVNVMKSSGCNVPEWMLNLKKPTTSIKKNIKKRPIKRDNISTVPAFDKKRQQHKKNIIAQSKKQKNE
ncbi:hypothetical protein BB561_005964 [Smittium simulii]|uniref:RNA helicase n=1 Tax=Smittium simulii TaxID=133385 RepID=A0A2T9Y7A3_9FUNG|nr:hypothetical protein BB561_005964 [Smittium simulii]